MTNRTLTVSTSKDASSSACVFRSVLDRARRPSLRRFFVGVAGAVSMLLASQEAGAQEWLKDRRYQEGAGIRTGDVELHPGIGGEIGYDSNFFLRTHKENPRFINGGPTHFPVESGVIRVTPSFSISTIGAQRQEANGALAMPSPLAFRGDIAATYREFLGPEEIRQQRNVSGNASARLDINQSRPVGFGVFANYQRFIQP